MTAARFVPLGPLDSNPNSRAFLGYEQGLQGPKWPVVIVWVPEEVEADEDRLQQLLEDTERAAQIDSPNVNRVVGCHLLDEGHARVVEYSDGESLRAILTAATAAKIPVPVGFLLRVIADAAAGLHHVHEMGQAEGNVRGRLHGALRPETVIVGFNGIGKVTGYGAHAVAPRDVFGARLSPRLQYQSPEEFEGGAGAADRRSDVYALSLVFFEAVAGRIPYRITDPDFEEQVLAGRIPVEMLESVPTPVREAIAKGLARKPSDRFPTAGVMRQALEALEPWTASQVSQLCLELMPDTLPDRAARLQLLREAGFTPGQLPRPLARKKPPPSSMSVVPEPAPVAPPPAASVSGSPPPTTAIAQAAAGMRPASTASMGGFFSTPSIAGPQGQATTKSVPQAGAAASPSTTNSAPAVASPSAPYPASRSRPRSSVAVAPRSLTPTPAKSGLSPTVGLLGGLAVVGLLLGGLFIGRPDLWKALVTGTPMISPEPVVQTAPHPKPAPPPPDVAPEPAPLPPPGPAAAKLELTSDPPLQVSVDGQHPWTTPTSLEVPPGEHHIRFRDPKNGIDIEKIVKAKEGGHYKIPIHLSRASMEITAPEGAEVFLDGNLKGKAPVGELKFYEGHHSIKVKMGKAVFDRTFTAAAGEALTLDVKPTPAP